MEQTKRSTGIQLARAGHGAVTIIKLTGYARNTVYDIYTRFKNEEKEERSPHSARSDCKVTLRFLAGLKRTVTAHPSLNQTTLPKKKSVARSTIQNALGELCMNSYKLSVRHLLTEKQKKVRLAYCKTLLSRLKTSNASHTIILSGEKIFTIERKRNFQKHRWVFTSKDNVPYMYNFKKSSSIMVLGGITSAGKVMHQLLFKKGETVNSTVYVEYFRSTVLPQTSLRVATGLCPLSYVLDQPRVHQDQL
ncbi:uncharacterized protein [Lepeophtheirus salmonis]|uniref:uncharacterized protein n=1 Tax=Lepeophtheirus salmonis TaxID=72036 RepID=UPI003AF37969